MDKERAIRAFAALAQESRLGVFRLLVRTGAEGMAAGEIARALSPDEIVACSDRAGLRRRGGAGVTPS